MKNVLLDKGIILPSGEISKDKVNLVIGAITQPFAEMVWVNESQDRHNLSIVSRSIKEVSFVSFLFPKCANFQERHGLPPKSENLANL